MIPIARFVRPAERHLNAFGDAIGANGVVSK
jgi:hypothetical protein